MEYYYEDSAGVFWYFCQENSSVTRAIGKNGLWANKKEDSFPDPVLARNFVESCLQVITAQGFTAGSGKPEFDMAKLTDWKHMVYDYTRYLVNQPTGEFWCGETRKDPTHNLIQISVGQAGLMGISLATNIGDDNADALAYIDKICAIYLAKGYVEESVPADLPAWKTYGAILNNLKDPRAPKPLTLEEVERLAKIPASTPKEPRVHLVEPPAQSVRALSAEELITVARAVTPEYEALHQGVEVPQDLAEWPVCLKYLAPYEDEIRADLPEAIAEAIERHGAKKFAGLPIGIDQILGTCPMWFFVRCPNLPEHHRPDFYVSEESSADQFRMLQSRYGTPYVWADITLIDGKDKNWPLRLAYNRGDADTNDGLWGGVWERTGMRRIADIRSTGDNETSIAVDKSFAKTWDKRGGWLPLDFDTEQFDFFLTECMYVNEHEVEKLLHLALIMIDDQVP